MVVSRAISATGCASCRISLLRSFTAITGLSPRKLNLSPKLPHPRSTPRVRFSSSTTHNGEHHREFVHTETTESRFEPYVDEALGGGDVETGGGSSEPSSLPWYLEVDTSPRPQQLLSERHRIPDLPDSPPPILQPLIQQLSVDLGLDSLTLLDLRKLDPPPALGANLIMLLGTARSEKHLHVSADRLCRWLRGAYKLRPDADGLLGRNELKLKLKRKSKRAKLLGKTAADNEDDGVRTGWVCVDVGVVDGAENSTSSVPEPEGFIGFGRRTDGVRIVVQMMTEEKREEMDLEKLWRGILKRGVPTEMESLEEETPSSEHSSPTTDHALVDAPIGRLGNASPMFSYSRGFHTSTRHFFAEQRAFALGEVPIPNGPDARVNSREIPGMQEIQEFVASSIGSGHYKEAMEYLRHLQNDIPELQNEGWRRLLLNQLRLHLENVPNDQALSCLGSHSSDRDSTPFLLCFYQSLPSSSSPKLEGDMLIWLYCYARQLGHSGYGFGGLMELFSGLQLRGIEISMEAYLCLLQSSLRPQIIQNKYHGPARHRVEGAVKILQAMYNQGHDILTEEVFITLQEASAPDPKSISESDVIHISSSDTFDLQSLPMSSIQRRIHVLMRSIDMPSFGAESRLRLLDLYSRQNNWLEFWDVWRIPLRRGQPQTAPLYAFMFNRIASTKHQRACINVLRTWFPDVEREVPAVPLKGEVAQAVKACLLVADPFVERDVGDPKAKGEWISMWRKCTKS